MPTTEFSDGDYRSKFVQGDPSCDQSINARALSRALDIRKFEIELYWRRASYFWTFIAAALAGFIAVQASQSDKKNDLSVLLCCLGVVFSFGWLCANRGSKFWQENWEYHVDMLEDPVQGPLYKVVLERSRPTSLKERGLHLLGGPTPFSVSKINQLISLFVTIMWCILLFYALPSFDWSLPVNWYYVAITSLSVLTCLGIAFLGRTYRGGFWHRGTIRTAKIEN